MSGKNRDLDRPVSSATGVSEKMETATAREPFGTLTEPYRRELRVHCYRMLGSLQDAEDVLQETLLAAWQGFGGFEGRSSVRTWLYTIATNRCLNARRAATRRPAKAYDVPGVDPPAPTGLGEVTWLEPFPDTLLDGPDVRYAQTESISLAFVTALQVLPHRQLAVLVLCDLLGFEASEVAVMLASTVDSVSSALKRARANLQQKLPRTGERLAPSAGSPAEDAIAARFVRAWESADVDALMALFTDDVFISMPPIPNEYQGRDLVARFCARIFDAGRRFALVATRANGQPAFGVYLRSDAGVSRGVGLYVLALRGDQICAMTRFEAQVLGSFALPAHSPDPPVST